MDLWQKLMSLRRPRPLLATLCIALAATILGADGAIVSGQSPDPFPSPAPTLDEPVGSPVPPLTATVGTVTSTPGIGVTPSAVPSVIASAIIPVEPPVVPTATNTPVLPPTPTNVPGPAASPTPFPSVHPTQAIWTEPDPTPDHSSVPFRPSPAPLTTEQLQDIARPSKIEYSLRKLAERYADGNLTAAERVVYPIEPGDFVRVHVIAKAGQTDSAINAVAGFGGRIGLRGDSYFSASVPLSAISQMENIPSIEFVNFESTPLSDSKPAATGLTALSTTQALGDMNWYTWNLSGQGYTGRGVKVGIVDTGFSVWSQVASYGELPAYPGIACEYRPGASSHGTAVAEIIHDIAPDAQLVLATASTLQEATAAITCLRGKGVHVISMSQSYGYDPSEGPGDGTGLLNSAVTSAVEQHGIFFSQAAGNYAKGHWRGTGADSNATGILELGGTPYEIIRIPAVPNGAVVPIFLRWGPSWEFSCNDYSIAVFDSFNGAPRYVGDFNSTQTCSSGGPTGRPVEFGALRNASGSTSDFWVGIRYIGGENPSHSGVVFDILCAWDIEPFFRVPSRSLSHPSDNTAACRRSEPFVKLSG